MKTVTFKLKSCCWIPRKTTLILREQKENGNVIVHHQGCSDFVVRKDEIISIQDKQEVK